MRHFFIDTNVLIDFFADRKPFSLDAARLFNHALNKNSINYISAVSYNNIYYILRQSNSHVETIKILSKLDEWTVTIDVSKEVIRKALKSNFKDFEDAIQYTCAKSSDIIECIIARDTKDFKSSSLPVMTPTEAIAFIYNDK
jgi:predicted nucleic acid-binding protein